MDFLLAPHPLLPPYQRGREEEGQKCPKIGLRNKWMFSKENEERTAKEKYEKKVQDDAERRRKNQENMSDVSAIVPLISCS